MIRFLTKNIAILSFLILFTAIAHAQGAGLGTVNTSKCTSAGPSVDGNGYTIFNAPNSSGGGGRTFYVSSSGGSDSYTGLAPTFTSGTNGPFLTITRGLTQLGTDTGKDDWL